MCEEQLFVYTRESEKHLDFVLGSMNQDQRLI